MNKVEKGKTIYLDALKQYCEPVSLSYFPDSRIRSTKKITIEDLYVPLKIGSEGIGSEGIDSEGIDSELDLDEIVRRIELRLAELEAQENGEISKEAKQQEPLQPKQQEHTDTSPASDVGNTSDAAAPYYVILRADPGCGKTTFCKRMALAYIKRDKAFFADCFMKDLPPERLPVYLPLGKLSQLSVADIEKLRFEDVAYEIALSSIKPECDKNDEWITREDFRAMMEQLAELDSGGLMFIVDGWDELLSSEKENIIWEKLLSYLAAHKNVALVLTVRSHYDSGFFRMENDFYSDFKRVVRTKKIEGLEPEQVEQYCKKWYALFYDGNAERQNGYRLILSQLNLKKNQVLKQVVKNPLMLSVVLLISRYQNSLPQNKASLFEEIIMAFLKRDVIKKSAKNLLSIFAYIAFQMTKREKLEISSVMLEELVSQAILDLQAFFPEAVSPDEKHTYLEEIKRTGLLWLPDQEQAYRFAWHRQIQEYLTAYAVTAKMVDRESAKITTIAFLSERVTVPAWQEVIHFAALMGGKSVARRLFSAAKPHLQLDKDDYNSWFFSLMIDIYPFLDRSEWSAVLDLRFYEHINTVEIKMLIDWITNPSSSSNDLIEYIDSKFRESVQARDRKYGYAAAIIDLAKAYEKGEMLFAYAEQLLQSDDDYCVTLGLLEFTLMGWMKHLSVRNELMIAVAKEAFLFSQRSIDKIKNLMKYTTRWLPIVALMLEDAVLAGFVSYCDIVCEEEKSLFCLLEADNDDDRKAAETILGLHPLASPLHDMLVTDAIQKEYVKRYEESLTAKEYDAVVPCFGRCFALGCWKTREEQSAELQRMLISVPYRDQEISTSYMLYYLSTANQQFVPACLSNVEISMRWRHKMLRLTHATDNIPPDFYIRLIDE